MFNLLPPPAFLVTFPSDFREIHALRQLIEMAVLHPDVWNLAVFELPSPRDALCESYSARTGALNAFFDALVTWVAFVTDDSSSRALETTSILRQGLAAS